VQKSANQKMEESNANTGRTEKVDDYSSDSQNTTVTTMEYPPKFKLVMIVVALVLSMFLVSEHWNLSFILMEDVDS
jgi:hypothetical protein